MTQLTRRSLFRLGAGAGLIAAPHIARADIGGVLSSVFGRQANASVLAQSSIVGNAVNIIVSTSLGDFGSRSSTIPSLTSQSAFNFIISIRSWNRAANPHYVLWGASDLNGYRIGEVLLENGTDPNYITLRLTLGDPGHTTATQSWVWPNAIPINPDIHTGLHLTFDTNPIPAPTFEAHLMVYSPQVPMSQTVRFVTSLSQSSYANGIQAGLPVIPDSNLLIANPDNYVGQAFPLHFLQTQSPAGSAIVVYYQGFKSTPFLTVRSVDGIGWQLADPGALQPGTELVISSAEWNPNNWLAQIGDGIAFMQQQVTASASQSTGPSQSRLFHTPLNEFYPTPAYYNTLSSQFSGQTALSPSALSGIVPGVVTGTNISIFPTATTPLYLRNNSQMYPSVWNPRNAEYQEPTFVVNIGPVPQTAPPLQILPMSPILPGEQAPGFP